MNRLSHSQPQTGQQSGERRLWSQSARSDLADPNTTLKNVLNDLGRESWPLCFEQSLVTAHSLLEFAAGLAQVGLAEWREDRALNTLDYLAYDFRPKVDFADGRLYQAAFYLRTAVEGVQRAVRADLKQTHGLEQLEIWPDETEFDSSVHEDSPTVCPLAPYRDSLAGRIARVTQNGFKLDGYVLRRARVIRYLAADRSVGARPVVSPRW